MIECYLSMEGGICMIIYKIKYIKECENIMEIKANSEKEALEKFYEFECIRNYEYQCLGEEIIEITKA